MLPKEQAYIYSRLYDFTTKKTVTVTDATQITSNHVHESKTNSSKIFLQQNQPNAQFWSLLNITLHVSDGLSVHHQEFKIVHTASGICHTGQLTACQQVREGTPFHLVPSETCRVIFNKFENCASDWFCYRNISLCTVT